MKRAWIAFGVVAALLAAVYWLGLRPECGVAEGAGKGGADHAFAPGEPPQLRVARLGTTEAPLWSWERLLAADGTPEEDLAALADMVAGYLQSGSGEGRRNLGFNEDLAAALTDRTALGEGVLPADHPALRDGRLIDRWGTPWQVHPLAADHIELRSAGPDRRLYTADDLISP